MWSCGGWNGTLARTPVEGGVWLFEGEEGDFGGAAVAEGGHFA
jgi:hypothetical protein